jgi:GGDEF domain-containing protein
MVAPYLVTALGMFLSVHFHRGRPFMALFLLVLFYWATRTMPIDASIELSLHGTYQAFVILIPVNLAFLALMRERGLFSTAGRLRLAFLAIQAAFAYWLFSNHLFDLLPYIAHSYAILPKVASLSIPEPALISGIVTFVLIAMLAIRRQTPIDSGLLGTLVAFFMACNWLKSRDIHTAYCASGALIMTLSVLRDSYNLAFRDELTGLPSRRTLNESLSGLGRRYTIAMLDVDHFKRFNDTYGHDVGDQVLKMVAQKLTGVGGGGRAYRYGGEEFTILFPRRAVSEAVPHLEELRKSIADYRIAIRGSERPKGQREGKGQRGRQGAGGYTSVTISIGVAERTEGLTSAEEVIQAADKALYKAKNKGRNQVCR